MSSHFLHRVTKITSFMKVTKSLYTIGSTGYSRTIYVEGRPIPCKDVWLTGFGFSGKGIQVSCNIHAMVPEDILQEIQLKNQGEVFLNAMMTELTSERGTINLLSNVVDIGENSYDLTETLMGLVAAQLYHQNERPTYVCEAKDLRERTVQYLTELFKNVRLPVTLADSIDCFDLALRFLYPFVIIDGDKVYYTHPLIIGFLARQGKLDLLNYSGSALLIELVKLMEKIHDTIGSDMPIYTDPTMDAFRGTSKRSSIDELFSIQRRIVLYKTLHRAFDQA